MKEKFIKSASVFSKAIIQPVTFMAVTGIILSVCAILELESMPNLIKSIGDFISNILSGGMTGQLGAMFCVGIAATLAKPKHKADAAILGAITYLILLCANNSWLTITNRLTAVGEQGPYGTGQRMVFGIQVTDIGVFLGISLGVFVDWMVNKFSDIRLHKYLSPYSGTELVYTLIMFAIILFTVEIAYVWSIVNSVIEAVVKTTTTVGSVGLFFYGFLNYLLLLVGLHHFLWVSIFYIPLGGTAEIAGQAYNDAFNIWLAKLGNTGQITTIHPSMGYLSNFDSISLPIGIAFALWKMVRLKNRKKAATILVLAVTTASLVGVTEPLEFLLSFLSPVLWLTHSIVYGLNLFITNLVGINIQFDTRIDMIINSLVFPIRLGHQYLIPVIFIATAALEYFVFKKLIVKLNIPTLGRERAEVISESVVDSIGVDLTGAKSDSGLEPQIQNIVAGLGSMNNIENVINCYIKLRADIRNENKVNIKILKEKIKASGIIDEGKHIQIVTSMGVEQEREKIEVRIEYPKKVHA